MSDELDFFAWEKNPEKQRAQLETLETAGFEHVRAAVTSAEAAGTQGQNLIRIGTSGGAVRLMDARNWVAMKAQQQADKSAARERRLEEMQAEATKAAKSSASAAWQATRVSWGAMTAAVIAALAALAQCQMATNSPLPHAAPATQNPPQGASKTAP